MSSAVFVIAEVRYFSVPRYRFRPKNAILPSGHLLKYCVSDDLLLEDLLTALEEAERQVARTIHPTLYTRRNSASAARTVRNRYVVFQALAHTLSLAPGEWRVLSEAHRKRNAMEYEGVADVDEQVVAAVLRVARVVEERVRRLAPVGGAS